MPDPDENRTASLGMRVWPSLKDAIDQVAKEDGRTTTQYIERLLIAHLREKGRWPK